MVLYSVSAPRIASKMVLSRFSDLETFQTFYAPQLGSGRCSSLDAPRMASCSGI